LHLAVLYGNPDLVKDVIKAGAVLDKVDDIGQSALHLAVYHGKVAEIQLLLDAEARVNNFDSSDQAPIDIAIRHCDVKIAKILRTHGALSASRSRL
jgi:ankyrin repeat protein